LRLGALIVLARIEEAAVFAAMQIGVAMRAGVGAHNLADDFDFSSTVLTNHNCLLLNEVKLG
jgi:hypothetical protein